MFILVEACTVGVILYFIIRINNTKSWDELDAEVIDKVDVIDDDCRPIIRICLPGGIYVEHKYNIRYNINHRIGAIIKIRYNNDNYKKDVYIPGSYIRYFLNCAYAMIFEVFIFITLFLIANG